MNSATRLSILRKILNLHNPNLQHVKQFKTTQKTLGLFWEKDEKGGYKDNRKPLPLTQQIKDGFKELKNECKLFMQEQKERFEFDPILIFRPGETDIAWEFGNKESLNQWVVTSDSDNNEGYSKCTLQLNQYGNALFSGELSTKVPVDGVIKRSGYCNIRTVRARRSFKRETYLDWTSYNTLVLKVRGDGRSYMLNIASKGYFDITWNDMYHFVLYTRGGPYWQLTRIPFSKFLVSSKGRVQDNQYPLALNRITSFGISAGDKINGPFQLEIQYIGLEFDPNHTEEFAYEMYEIPIKYIVNH